MSSWGCRIIGNYILLRYNTSSLCCVGQYSIFFMELKLWVNPQHVSVTRVLKVWERQQPREKERERERCLKAGEQSSESVEILLGQQTHDFSSVGK